MPDFKPGWYAISKDAQGTTTAWYFKNPDLVTAECTITADGGHYLGWHTSDPAKGKRRSLNSGYGALEVDHNGDWDHLQQKGPKKAKKATTGQTSGTSSGASSGASSSPCADLSQKCPVCDRTGLLIMPALYAVARSDVTAGAKAPALSAPFTGGHTSKFLLPDQLSQYTLRIPREGYIYLFNEKLGDAGWKGYQINGLGYISEFDIRSKSPPLPGAAGAPCGRRQTAQLARFISIPDAKSVGDIWLTFTDTPWTPDKLKQHKGSADLRKKNMRLIDGKALVASKGVATQDHVAPVALPGSMLPGSNLQSISEFGVANPFALSSIGLNFLSSFMPSPAFSDSLADFQSQAHLAQDVIRGVSLAQSSTGISPVMVALDDVTGIIADLNSQIFNRTHAWAEEPERKWKRESAHMLHALREAVKNGAVGEEEYSRQRASVIGSTIFGAHLRAIDGLSPAERMDRAGYISEENAEKIGIKTWDEDHKHLYNDAAQKKFLEETYPSQLKAFEASTINPLNDIYLRWLQSDVLKDYLQSNFDSQHLDSGHAYTQKLFLLVKDASGRRSVAEHMEKELVKDPAQPGHIIVRALLLNQDKLIDGWVQAIAQGNQADPSIEIDPLKWDKIADKTYGAIKKILKSDQYKAIAAGEPDKVAKEIFGTSAKYVHQIGGPIMNKLGQVFDKAATWAAAQLPEKRLIGLLGGIARADNPNLRLVDIRSVTTRKSAARKLADVIASYSGKSGEQYRSSIRQMLDATAEQNDARYLYNAVMVVDTKEAERLAELGASNQRAGRAELLRTSVARIEQMNGYTFGSMRKLFSLDAKANGVAAIFAGLTLRSAYHDMAKANRLEKPEKIAAFAGGIATLVGASVEASASLLEASAWGNSKHSVKLAKFMSKYSTRAKLLGFGGKVIGAVGSFISGVLAIKEGWDSRGVSTAYAATMIILGVGGVIAAVIAVFCTSLAMTGIGIILAIVIAVITLVVSYFKPTKVQKFLNASHWGQHRGGKRYRDQTEELEGLKGLAEA